MAIAQLIVVIVWWLLWLAPAPCKVRLWRFVHYVVLASLLLYSGVGTLVDWYNEQHPMKRVCKETVIYFGPSEKYIPSGTMAKDDVVRVIDAASDWVKVEKQATIGWMPIACLNDE